MRGPLLLTLIALVCGCSANDSTLIVELRTDLRSGVDFQSIQTRVFEGSSAEAEREVIALAPAARDLSTGFRAAEIPGLDAGAKRVEVALLDASSAVVAGRTIRTELSGTGAIGGRWQRPLRPRGRVRLDDGHLRRASKPRRVVHLECPVRVRRLLSGRMRRRLCALREARSRPPASCAEPRPVEGCTQ